MSSAAALLPFFAAAAPPPDQPGTLTHGVTRRNAGGVNIAAVLSDPDGITAVGASFVRAGDGTQANIAWARRDADSFTHADQRRNARWRSGTMAVTYTDGNGVERTLTENWSV